MKDIARESVAAIDKDSWDWVSIMDRFQTLADVLSEPPGDHAALAAELHEIADWIGLWEES